MQQFLRCLDTKSVIEKASSLQWREGKKSNVEAKPKHRKVVKFEKFNFLKNKNSESIVNSELMNQLDSFATAQNDNNNNSLTEREDNNITDTVFSLFTKPSRGISEAKVEHQSTETLSFRCWSERCRLMRGAVNYQDYKVAFTLAEVLITLGVIGVVAALTMPALIQNYRNQVVETRLKKFYSSMNQAISMSIKDNGDVETWSYFVSDKKDDDGNLVNRTDDNDSSFNNYLAPYLKIVDKKEVTDVKGQRRILYFFEDGSSFTFEGHENRDITFFPKNAEKCISKEKYLGSCAWQFEFYPIENVWYWQYLYDKKMEAALYMWDGNVSTLYNDSERGCNNRGVYCTAIIQRNGWKVPKDYPKRVAF